MLEDAAQPVLTVSWSLPFEAAGAISAKDFRASKPAVVVSHLIAYQGQGSLSEELRARGWTPDAPGPKVASGVPLSTEAGFALWQIRVQLTASGASHWREVVALIFAVLAALRHGSSSTAGKANDIQKSKSGGELPGSVLCMAADEVSALADLAWRYPDRSPTALELANDMRTAPCPSGYITASRRFFSSQGWKSAGSNAGGADARQAASETASRLLDFLRAEAASVVVAGAPQEPGVEWQRDPFYRFNFGECTIDAGTREAWQKAWTTPAAWWAPPPLNRYISRGSPAEDSLDDVGESPPQNQSNEFRKQATLRLPGVVWQSPCRPHLVPILPAGKQKHRPAVLWHAPGCLYASGQFSEVVEPLGDEPLGAITLWLPADRVASASALNRATGRLWLLSLQRTLEGPLYGASLAGCRWEAAFFSPRSDEEQNASAGIRLAFEAYTDVLPRFAVDVARLIGQHRGPVNASEMETVRGIARTELRGAATKLSGVTGVSSVLADVSPATVAEEAIALWKSCAAAAVGRSQALVTGRVGSDANVESIVGDIMTALPLGGVVADGAPLPTPETGALPAAVLTKRPTWQGPVAQSLCLASGVPSLVDVCGRAWNR